MLELRPFADALADAAIAGRAGDPAWQSLRWDIEELRVSLFAQELGAKGGVSPKKLAARIARLGWRVDGGARLWWSGCSRELFWIGWKIKSSRLNPLLRNSRGAGAAPAFAGMTQRQRRPLFGRGCLSRAGSPLSRG